MRSSYNVLCVWVCECMCKCVCEDARVCMNVCGAPSCPL